jgi:outer membrane biogenesis lipoprotein LolB
VNRLARRRPRATATLVLLAATLSACAAKAPARPGGTPVAAPAAAQAFAAATAHCAGLRTVTATIRLSGRIGAQRVRARLLAGFAAPASLRLEAVAPFGPPGFVLAASGDRSTLVFPREAQVLDGASVADVLDALAGLPLGADDLRRLLLGCPAGEPRDGLGYAGGWNAVEVSDGARAYVRAVAGAPVLAAVDLRGWQADYAVWSNGIARSVRLRRAGAGGATDLTAALDDLNLNIDLPTEAFEVAVPAEARPITLDDLRAASPLQPTGRDD